MSQPDSKPLLLFITRDAPSERGGNGVTVYNHDVLANLAAHGFDVHVLLLEPYLLRGRLPWVKAQASGSPFKALHPGYVKIGGRFWHLKGILCFLRNQLSRWFKFVNPMPPLAATTWGNELTPEEKTWVQAVRLQKKWDVVICNYCWLADSLTCFEPQTKKAVLTHDVWHQHLYRKSDNLHMQALNRYKEAAYLNLADIVIAITQRDGDVFKEMVKTKKIIVAPMSCSPRFNDKPPKPGRLFFVGSGYIANVDGVNWFLNEVAPVLESKKPGCFEFHVAGLVGDALVGNRNGIKVVKKGIVVDLDIEYAQAQIVLIPLLGGTGLKIKLVEAIGHGKAIITTRAGAQGVESLEGRSFVLAESAEEFARAILEISENDEKRFALELGARESAINIFSPDACYRQLVSELKQKDNLRDN
jgi:glycosyltransferase involved in cell wall biosynthesis